MKSTFNRLNYIFSHENSIYINKFLFNCGVIIISSSCIYICLYACVYQPQLFGAHTIQKDKCDDKHSYLLPPHTILIYITNASNY